MKPLVTQSMVNSTGGNVDGGFTSDRSSMVADDLGELDEPLLKSFTSVELMGNMVAKQAANRKSWYSSRTLATSTTLPLDEYEEVYAVRKQQGVPENPLSYGVFEALSIPKSRKSAHWERSPI